MSEIEVGYKKGEVVGFYDEYVRKQEKIGVNIRHRSIMYHLKRAGLRKNSTVLEIGCGIGTVTGLLAKSCSQGKVVAVDISPESIRRAEERLKNHKHVSFLVSDMSDFSSTDKFDFVVLPDVLEHIPIEQHHQLFHTLNIHTHPASVVFIHIPDPRYLRWVKEHKPQLLQIIDQPLDTDKIIGNFYNNGFYIHTLKSYSLAVKGGDYQVIVLKKKDFPMQADHFSKLRNAWKEVKSRFFGQL